MTVSSDNYEPQIYVGNGSTTAFSTVWAFDTSADIVVTERVIATGVETEQTLTTDYTVSGGSGLAGTVTAVVAPASTVHWVLSRATTKTQDTDYTANDAFPADTHEAALDKVMRVAQETAFDAVRSLRFPTTDATGLSAVLPSSVDRASMYLAFDASGNPVASAAAAGTAVTTAFTETMLDDETAAAVLTTLGIDTADATTKGVVELATAAEVVAGTDTDRAITPAGLGTPPPMNMADGALTRPKLLDYGETVNALGDLGGGTDDIDIELGNVVTATVSTATQTFTFSNPSATGVACSFTLILTNGGSQTVNWPASVDWAGGNAPSLTASGVDVLTFVTVDAGTTWYGFSAGLDMS